MNYAILILLQGWLGKDDPAWLYFVPLWPLGFVGIWAIWNILRDSHDEKSMERSLNWPEAQGRIVSSKTVWGHVEIGYEYWVFAERHEGTYKISLHPVVPGGKGAESASSAMKLGSEAREDMAQYPVGTKAIVRYNRARPEESVLYCKGEVGSHAASTSEVEPPHFVTLE